MHHVASFAVYPRTTLGTLSMPMAIRRFCHTTRVRHHAARLQIEERLPKGCLELRGAGADAQRAISEETVSRQTRSINCHSQEPCVWVGRRRLLLLLLVTSTSTTTTTTTPTVTTASIHSGIVFVLRAATVAVGSGFGVRYVFLVAFPPSVPF